MLYGLLLSIFVMISGLLIIIILLQQGKGGLGLGAIGSTSQMIFGGSGGQDVFQKATWILGALFMSGSLLLALMKTRQLEEGGVVARRTAPVLPVQQQMPTHAPAPEGPSPVQPAPATPAN